MLAGLLAVAARRGSPDGAVGRSEAVAVAVAVLGVAAALANGILGPGPGVGAAATAPSLGVQWLCLVVPAVIVGLAVVVKSAATVGVEGVAFVFLLAPLHAAVGRDGAHLVLVLVQQALRRGLGCIHDAGGAVWVVLGERPEGLPGAGTDALHGVTECAAQGFLER